MSPEALIPFRARSVGNSSYFCRREIKGLYGKIGGKTYALLVSYLCEGVECRNRSRCSSSDLPLGLDVCENRIERERERRRTTTLSETHGDSSWSSACSTTDANNLADTVGK